MDKVIVYTHSKYGLAVCIPAPDDRRPGEVEDAWLKRVSERSIPKDAKDVRVCSRNELPKDRTFRDAWVHRGGKIDVDMPKAREIHRHRIRKARAKLLRKLDQEQLIAMAKDDRAALQKIESSKQALRDAPAHPSIDGAQSPDELKTAWPLPKT